MTCLGAKYQISFQPINQAGRDFPGGAVAWTLCSQCKGPGFYRYQGARSHMPQLRLGQSHKILINILKSRLAKLIVRILSGDYNRILIGLIGGAPLSDNICRLI